MGASSEILQCCCVIDGGREKECYSQTPERLAYLGEPFYHHNKRLGERSLRPSVDEADLGKAVTK